eukprot:4665408-Pleurochrysis_carterae.AAC.1
MPKFVKTRSVLRSEPAVAKLEGTLHVSLHPRAARILTLAHPLSTSCCSSISASTFDYLPVDLSAFSLASQVRVGCSLSPRPLIGTATAPRTFACKRVGYVHARLH